ncbi:MAG: PfkB family carbohydrate kinase [Acidimicrobiia bacterium]|jgi:1-phosphofructokinase
MAHEDHIISIFAPHLTLTVTIEAGREDGPDDIHIHPGGQGFWVARMLRHLKERPLLCGPVGGESGGVLRSLISQWGIDLSPLDVQKSSPAIVQDRRSGDRASIAKAPAPSLTRHELDDAYGRILDHALSSEVVVITGQNTEIVPVDTYRRLGHDLASAGVPVVGDLHGNELEAFLEGGHLELLKISDEDLIEDGTIEGEDEDMALDQLHRLRESGAKRVVISRGPRPALALIDGVTYRVTGPDLEPADYRGAGDSMTAGLAAGLRRGLAAEELLRLASGAGAANVTRHGLGSASDDLIPRLAERVEIEVLTPLPQ